MDNFKIIAIKTGSTGMVPANFRKGNNTSVETDSLRNIQKNTIYTFYNCYSFPNQVNFNEIIYHPDKDIDLYSLELSNGNKIPISISAVVGENGSGKSTLIELLYWMNYNLGCAFKLLKDKDGNEYETNPFLEIEVLYSVNTERLFVLKFENNNAIKQQEIILKKNRYRFNSYSGWRNIYRISSLQKFFYTVVVNYSQYALNALEVGEWINPLFHKNDGYQTPIVLNPMRHDGNIDINKERALLSRRLQANVLEKVLDEEKNSLRNLGNDKIAEIFKCEYDLAYFQKMETEHGQVNRQEYKSIVEAIQKHFAFEITESSDFIYNEFCRYITTYLYYKLRKIVFGYVIYEDYRARGKKLRHIDDLIEEIRDSDSHVIFKVKGAILHLKYYQQIYGASGINFDYPFDLKIDDLYHVIEEHIRSKEEFYINTYMMAMPSFFRVEVVPGNSLSIASLSSGEKQKIYSLSSIAYHLINLNSVEEQKLKEGNRVASYGYINLVLDEIELYYHPEWQRTYIYDLLNYLQKINPKSLEKIKGINIIFVTHSPYILSDLPASNILRLVKGSPEQPKIGEETFGANIHNLLAQDFFMRQGFMGEMSRVVINQLFQYLQTRQKKDRYFDRKKAERLIPHIGEPIVRQELSRLFDEKFESDLELELIEKEIQRLNALKARKRNDSNNHTQS